MDDVDLDTLVQVLKTCLDEPDEGRWTVCRQCGKLMHAREDHNCLDLGPDLLPGEMLGARDTSRYKRALSYEV